MKFFNLKAASIALAVTVSAVALAPQEAQAGRTGAYIAGGILGGLALGALAYEHNRRYYGYYEPRRYRRAYYPRRRARGYCGRWHYRCGRNWGYHSGDYYGCMRYHGC